MKSLKRGTLLCLLTGTIALTLAGGYHPFSLFCILLSCFFGFMKERILIPPLLRKEPFINILILSYLVIFIVDIIMMRDPISSLTRLLTFLLIIKVLNIQQERDYLLIILLSFIQLTIAASLTTDLSFIIPFLFFLFFSMPALIASTYRGESGIMKVSLRYFFSVSLLGFLFFFVIPHYGTGYFGINTRSTEKETGFSEKVDLGDIGKAKKNSKVVMRIELPFTMMGGEHLRYRGIVFDSYDGVSWMKTNHDFKVLNRRGDEILLKKERLPFRKRLKQIISLEPIDTPSIFFAGEPLAIYTFDFKKILLDDYGDLTFSFPRRRRVHYEVVSRRPSFKRQDLLQADWSDFPEKIKKLYLQLPPIDKGIEDLAQQFLVASNNQYELCKKIESYLAKHYYYSLDTGEIDPAHPLRSFLIDKKAGDCEFFATSMTVMLRILKIPSRVVGGYAGGKYSFFSGQYIIRQSDAHLWVETFFNGIGWVPFDPTPAEYADQHHRSFLSFLTSYRDFIELSWDTYIISLDLQDQMSFLERMIEYGQASYIKGKKIWRQLTGAMAERVQEKMAPSWKRIILLVSLGAFLFLLTAVLLWMRKMRGNEENNERCQIDFYEKFLSLMKRKGFRKWPWQTPKEFQRDISKELERSRSPIKDLFLDDVRQMTELYYAVRFGKKAIGKLEKRDLLRRFRNLKRYGRVRFH